MANGLENTSNTFVGNSNVGWTKNGTKRLRYILLLKNGAVSPYLLSDTFIQELTLHMGKWHDTWLRIMCPFSHRLCKGTLPPLHWKPETELKILTSGKFSGSKIKWDRSKIRYLRNTDVRCRWLIRLQFPLWGWFLGCCCFFFFFNAHSDFWLHHLDPVLLCYLCRFWVVFPDWLWLSSRAKQREGCPTSQWANTKPAANAYCT